MTGLGGPPSRAWLALSGKACAPAACHRTCRRWDKSVSVPPELTAWKTPSTTPLQIYPSEIRHTLHGAHFRPSGCPPDSAFSRLSVAANGETRYSEVQMEGLVTIHYTSASLICSQRIFD